MSEHNEDEETRESKTKESDEHKNELIENITQLKADIEALKQWKAQNPTEYRSDGSATEMTKLIRELALREAQKPPTQQNHETERKRREATADRRKSTDRRNNNQKGGEENLDQKTPEKREQKTRKWF